MKPIYIIIFAVCALPLALLPFVGFATMMAIANIGQLKEDDSLLLVTVSILTMILACAYPIPYFYSLSKTVKLSKDNKKPMRSILIPPVYLAIVLLMMLVWRLTEKAFG